MRDGAPGDGRDMSLRYLRDLQPVTEDWPEIEDPEPAAVEL